MGRMGLRRPFCEVGRMSKPIAAPEPYAKISMQALVELSKNELMVYGALMSFQGNNSRAYPTLKAISERLSGAIKTRQISQINQRLQKMGWITIERYGYGRANRYIVHSQPIANVESESLATHCESNVATHCELMSQPIAKQKRTTKQTTEINRAYTGPTGKGNGGSGNKKGIRQDNLRAQRSIVPGNLNAVQGHTGESQNQSDADGGVVVSREPVYDYPALERALRDDPEALRLLELTKKPIRDMTSQEFGDCWDFDDRLRAMGLVGKVA